jgi:hypothetical protein
MSCEHLFRELSAKNQANTNGAWLEHRPEWRVLVQARTQIPNDITGNPYATAGSTRTIRNAMYLLWSPLAERRWIYCSRQRPGKLTLWTIWSNEGKELCWEGGELQHHLVQAVSHPPAVPFHCHCMNSLFQSILCNAYFVSPSRSLPPFPYSPYSSYSCTTGLVLGMMSAPIVF